jgi:hypothetical protein
MLFRELNFGEKWTPLEKRKETEKAEEGLTRKLYNLMKEIYMKELPEKRKKEIESLRNKSLEKESECPRAELSGLRELAQEHGFDEILIRGDVSKIASPFPEKILFFPEGCFLPWRKVKEFAPDFARKGMDSVFSHQSQFLKEKAFEIGKELYKKMEENFLITESLKAIPRWLKEVGARGIFLDKKVIGKIEIEEEEKLRKMDKEIDLLKKEREIKVFEQDKLSAGSEEEAVNKMATFYVFLELMYGYKEDNIESILGKTLLPSLLEEKGEFGKKVMAEIKEIKSRLRKKHEESKMGSMYV